MNEAPLRIRAALPVGINTSEKQFTQATAGASERTSGARLLQKSGMRCFHVAIPRCRAKLSLEDDGDRTRSVLMHLHNASIHHDPSAPLEIETHDDLHL